ncbi:hypothetical protein [Luteimicrobium subarcticum]|uniref:Uncharacterized protein n=1 Tax=Luteimicrobium subarcticum TaxID=620910 RepID=A0A2M8WW15_9MICO|nr:hypothetical protein [Luteimicrobium subarcticum]PJI95108.1 hypothetical protein CLV34_0961 [Luteimicrobium subarcticum]
MSAPATVLDPTTAPPRPDLAFLRHRARPRPVAEPAPVLDLTPPAPGPVASVVPAAPAVLDLAPPAGAAAPAAPGREPLAPLLGGLRRLGPGERLVLDDDTPVVQLGRVTSGVGGLVLTLETAVPSGLAVLYELGGTQGVLRGPEPGFAPDHRRPVVSLTGNKIQLDLRLVRDLERFLVAVRGTRFDGVLVVRTVGGARLEVPMRTDTRTPAGSAAPSTDLVALSAYRVRGALVLRAEDLVVEGGLREVAGAFGYRELTWRSADTPLGGS